MAAACQEWGGGSDSGGCVGCSRVAVGDGTGCGDQPGGRSTGRGGSDLVAALSNAFSASVDMVL